MIPPPDKFSYAGAGGQPRILRSAAASLLVGNCRRITLPTEVAPNRLHLATSQLQMLNVLERLTVLDVQDVHHKRIVIASHDLLQIEVLDICSFC